MKKTNLRTRFGVRLRALREEMGMSQEAFADKCGYARSYMSRLERGQGNPSLDAVEVLVKALGTTVPEFFENI